MTELSPEDKQFIKDLREKHEDGKINRRQALGMLGAAGVGAAGGFFGTGSASADASTSDSDGNVGTPSDRVDVFGEGGDFNSLSADELSTKTNTGKRKLTDPGSRSVSVPTDFDTIQEAIDSVSLFPDGGITRINVESGYQSSEDLHIRPFTGTSVIRSEQSQERAVQISGPDSTDPTKASINSALPEGVNDFAITAMEINGVTPYTNEDSGILAYKCGEVEVNNCRFDSMPAGSRAIESYDSYVGSAGCHFDGSMATAFNVHGNGSLSVTSGSGSTTSRLIDGEGDLARFDSANVSVSTGNSAIPGDTSTVVIDTSTQTILRPTTFESANIDYLSGDGGPLNMRSGLNLFEERVGEVETGATNADHTTGADTVWLVEDASGTVYEVPLRQH